MSSYVTHTLAPVYDSSSRVLILGTMPSPKSREAGFYYAHPQNRFWPVLAALFAEPIPVAAADKKDFALRHHIALWDVLHACRIEGAGDSTIRDPVPNDIAGLLEKSAVRAVFTTGKKAAGLYRRLCLPSTGLPAFYLPSPSPANCRGCTKETLIKDYQILLEYLC